MNYIKTVKLKPEQASKEGAGGLLRVLAFSPAATDDLLDYWLLGTTLGDGRFAVIGWYADKAFAEVTVLP